MGWYSRPAAATTAGANMLRPSKITGWRSAARMRAKSGLRNSFHSVTMTSASASCSASIAPAAKLKLGDAGSTRRASVIATGS